MLDPAEAVEALPAEPDRLRLAAVSLTASTHRVAVSGGTKDA